MSSDSIIDLCDSGPEDEVMQQAAKRPRFGSREGSGLLPVHTNGGAADDEVVIVDDARQQQQQQQQRRQQAGTLREGEDFAIVDERGEGVGGSGHAEFATPAPPGVALRCGARGAPANPAPVCPLLARSLEPQPAAHARRVRPARLLAAAHRSQRAALRQGAAAGMAG